MRYLIALLTVFVSVSAQDNPYAVFGYEDKTTEVLHNPLVVTLVNEDTTASVSRVEIDYLNKMVFVFNQNKFIPHKVRLRAEQILRWLSVDPKFNEYPQLTPYNFVDNNPLYYIDPDGRRLVVADKAQQAIVLGYLKDQIGSDIYNFDKSNNLRLDKKAYNAVRGTFNKEQISISEGLTTVIKSNRIIEARLYPDQNVNFSRNPLIPVNSTYYDSDLQKTVTNTTYEPAYSGEGYIISSLTGKSGRPQSEITFAIPEDDRAFILIDYNEAKTATFEAEGGGKTNSCGSCIFIHAVLDHGLDYIKTGSISEPKGSSKKDNVFFNNAALKNKGLSIRTGSEHE